MVAAGDAIARLTTIHNSRLFKYATYHYDNTSCNNAIGPQIVASWRLVVRDVAQLCIASCNGHSFAAGRRAHLNSRCKPTIMHPRKLARLAWKLFAVLVLLYYATYATIDYLARATVTSAVLLERQTPPTVTACAKLAFKRAFFESPGATYDNIYASMYGKTGREILNMTTPLAEALGVSRHTFTATPDFLLDGGQCAILNMTSAGGRLRVSPAAEQYSSFIFIYLAPPKRLPHGIAEVFHLYKAAEYSGLCGCDTH